MKVPSRRLDHYLVLAKIWLWPPATWITSTLILTRRRRRLAGIQSIGYDVQLINLCPATQNAATQCISWYNLPMQWDVSAKLLYYRQPSNKVGNIQQRRLHQLKYPNKSGNKIRSMALITWTLTHTQTQLSWFILQPIWTLDNDSRQLRRFSTLCYHLKSFTRWHLYHLR